MICEGKDLIAVYESDSICYHCEIKANPKKSKII